MTQTSILDVPSTSMAPDDGPEYLRGPVLRTLLAVLAGLLVILAGILTLAVLDVAITPGSTLLAVGAYVLPTVGGWVLWVRRHPARPRRPIGWRNVVGGLVTAMALIGAVFVAQAIQPSTVERFVSLQSKASSSYTDGVLKASAGDRVEVGWELRGYGVDLSADPVVTVTLDSVMPHDLSLAAAAAPAPEGTGFTSGLAGKVTFTGPTEPGRHEVVVKVNNASDPAGGQELVLQLEVAP